MVDGMKHENRIIEAIRPPWIVMLSLCHIITSSTFLHSPICFTVEDVKKEADALADASSPPSASEAKLSSH